MAAQAVLITECLAGKRFHNRSFKGQDLSRQNMRGSLFFACDFDDANLSEVDCTGSDFTCSTFRNSILYKTNMKDCKLGGVVLEPKDAYGLTLTLQCRTFDGLKLGPIWSFAWLIFFTMMKHSGQAYELTDKVIADIGGERYAKLCALFLKREL